jgi:hypothetical protein
MTSRTPSTSSLQPVVKTHDVFCARFRAFRSSAPVVNQIAPACQTAISGVTCGLPLERLLGERQNGG